MDSQSLAAGGRSKRASTPMPGFRLDTLSREELELECGHPTKFMAVAKNKDIMVAGSHYDTLFLSHDGWLIRYKILHHGRRQIVDFVLPGEIFGLQASMFAAALYSVATITSASLSAIPVGLVDTVFERSPRLSKVLFRSALCEAAILGEHLIDAARRSAYERIGHLLLELWVRLKSGGLADGMSYCMPLTQEHIADALGLTTVHVNRTLRLLRQDGLVALNGGKVTILDFAALSGLSDFENSYLGDDARALRAQMTDRSPNR